MSENNAVLGDKEAKELLRNVLKEGNDSEAWDKFISAYYREIRNSDGSIESDIAIAKKYGFTIIV